MLYEQDALTAMLLMMAWCSADSAHASTPAVDVIGSSVRATIAGTAK